MSYKCWKPASIVRGSDNKKYKITIKKLIEVLIYDFKQTFILTRENLILLLYLAVMSYCLLVTPRYILVTSGYFSLILIISLYSPAPRFSLNEFLYVCEQTFILSKMRIPQKLKVIVMWNFWHIFYMKTFISTYFQVCISLSLN